MQHSIKRVCDKHNAVYRNVRNLRSCGAESFFGTAEGNALICGGDEYSRKTAMLRAVLSARKNREEPVIVMTNTPATVTKLIELADNNRTGTLYVCSSDYKCYDPFFGMPRNLISDYFGDLALAKGYRATDGIHSFVDAFLCILSTGGQICLSSMLEFSEYSDTQIAEIANGSNLSFEASQILASQTGGVAFRRLLRFTEQILGEISRNETHFNLYTAIGIDALICIDTNTTDNDLLALFFKEELRACISKRFTLVLDDCTFLDNEEFSKFINTLKQRTNVNLIVAHENIFTVYDENELAGFGRKCILLDGSVSSADIQRILTLLGEYTHFEPTKAVGAPPAFLFTVLEAPHFGITSYQRPKVIFEEEAGKKAVLHGHNGTEILICRDFGGEEI